MVLGKLDIYMQKNETGPYLIPLTKNNSKWIKDLNIILEIIKFLGESIGEKLLNIGLGNNFFYMTPKV